MFLGVRLDAESLAERRVNENRQQCSDPVDWLPF
jgi:hypothetical protein